jgi:hypothetical protein
MKKDEIIELAKQAGPLISTPFDEWCVKFAELVAAKEREACAALAEQTVCDTHIPTGIQIYGGEAAKAIRARGSK